MLLTFRLLSPPFNLSIGKQRQGWSSLSPDFKPTPTSEWEMGGAGSDNFERKKIHHCQLYFSPVFINLYFLAVFSNSISQLYIPTIWNQLQLQNGMCRSRRGQIWQLLRKKINQLLIVNCISQPHFSTVFLYQHLQFQRPIVGRICGCQKSWTQCVYSLLCHIYVLPNAMQRYMHNHRSSKKRSHLYPLDGSINIDALNHVLSNISVFVLFYLYFL